MQKGACAFFELCLKSSTLSSRRQHWTPVGPSLSQDHQIFLRTNSPMRSCVGGSPDALHGREHPGSNPASESELERLAVGMTLSGHRGVVHVKLVPTVTSSVPEGRATAGWFPQSTPYGSTFFLSFFLSRLERPPACSRALPSTLVICHRSCQS